MYIDSDQRQEIEDVDNLERWQQQTNKGRKGDFFRVAKNIVNSKIACNVEKKALEYLPDIYENLSGKIKNKKLDSDSTKKLVRYELSYGQNKLE